MFRKFISHICSLTLLSVVVSSAAMMTGCANIGNPSGGPRDEDPPILVSATPGLYATDVDRRKMTLSFNEIVNVKDAFQNVVVSPPGQAFPRISALGRKINIEFDSLSSNTTYTLDFGNAIEDNNEGNQLKNFSYTFATGPNIDTLRIAGRVLGARDLEPQQGMLVGAYANTADSAFTSMPMLRVAKTDDRGRFTIRGLSPGEYRVFALADRDNNFRYSTPEEDVAFLPYTVSPTAERVTARDTIYNIITGRPDTVVSRQRTRFLPNDILLRSFNSLLRQQYLAKYERPDSNRIYLKFNTKAGSLPSISVPGHPEISSIGIPESSERLDSVFYWLHPAVAAIDSLQLALTYLRTDSTGALSQYTDSLQLYRAKPAAKKVKKVTKLRDAERRKLAQDSLAALSFSFSPEGGQQKEVNTPLLFSTPAPVVRFDTTAMHLEVMRDSVWQRVTKPYRISRPDSLLPRNYRVEYPWELGAKYRLSADTLAATDMYGRTSLPLDFEFTVKKADEYCSLTLNITGLEPNEGAFVELVDSSDKVVATQSVTGNIATFRWLAPGRYYARIILDTNGNGIYDTGNYEAGLQPEVAYYYPKAFNIKKNWDKQETWDIFATAIDLQKPETLLRNKPTAPKHSTSSRDKKSQSDDEDDE